MTRYAAPTHRFPGYLLLLALFALMVPAAAQARFSAGAARVDTTPRLAGKDDPNGFATACPGFTGPRIWADDEPYLDANGNGRYDPGEPSCDRNGNERHDQIFDSGADIGSPRPALAVHDPLDARAIALSDGRHVVVVVSVVAQGLFNTYIDRMIARAKQLDPRITDMIVSANHNESSPDTVGLYGGALPGGALLGAVGGLPAGGQSGIDDYYMGFLVERVAQAAARAARALRPATLAARQFRLPRGLDIRLSDNWPTTDNSIARPTAIDPKIGLLQARGRRGHPIFTVMSLAAHNQEIGHSGSPDLSSDWPGYFHSSLQARVGGLAMFLVGDNGSEEDPCTGVPRCDPEPKATFARAQTTGRVLASAVAAQARHARSLRPGALRYRRSDFCVPIENNLFKAAAIAGLFGARRTYADVGGHCVPSPQPSSLQTTVSLLDVGPDLQLIANPGEAFPALVLGSPWRRADVPAACRDRPNPPVPTWRAHARYRLQVGLANDFIGYEIPPWAYIGSYGTILSAYGDPGCQTGTPQDPTDSTDGAGHHHKLETEGVGPTGAAAVATHLSALVAADSPDRSARIVPGRYVRADGRLSQFPSGAAGILAGRRLVATPGAVRFGRRRVDATGLFMDYDGRPQRRPDVTTRGMVVFDRRGCVRTRYYLDAFPDFTAPRPLGRRRSGRARRAATVCRA